MQSQQKKVKWSRGETSDALEERTDTGITNVSVARMENCVADIYGNVSRRPSFALHTEGGIIGAGVDVYPLTTKHFTFVFSIDAFQYFILVRTGPESLEGWKVNTSSGAPVVTKAVINITLESIESTYGNNPCVTQYNNYMICLNLIGPAAVLTYDPSSDGLTLSQYDFTGPWYAPGKTETATVEAQQVPGLIFNSNTQGIAQHSVSDGNTARLYDALDTGLTGPSGMDTISQIIKAGDILRLPNLACIFRVEGFTLRARDGKGLGGKLITHTEVSAVYSNTTPDKTKLGTVAFARQTQSTSRLSIGAFLGASEVWIYRNGVEIEHYDGLPQGYLIKNTASSTGYSSVAKGTWADASVASLGVFVYGAALTPVVSNTATDETFSIDTGFQAISPVNGWYPMTATFLGQRLFIGDFKCRNLTNNTLTTIPGFVVGSQLGRYTDFKADYNLKTEPITIDIATKYQEEVLHLVPYVGLKVFTDSQEYAYDEQSGIQPQSSNGTVPYCEPIVFKSLVLYLDRNERQIKAMQYELQSSIFNSSVINLLAPMDLVFRPVSLIKRHSAEAETGDFLYCVQPLPSLHGTSYYKNSPSVAVCNLVPSTQTMIWGRWHAPRCTDWNNKFTADETVIGAVEFQNKVWFIIKASTITNNATTGNALLLADLRYDGLADYEQSVSPNATRWVIRDSNQTCVFKNATVSIFDNGVWQWDDTLDTLGNFTRPLTGLANPSVGFKINAVLDSHPIDIAGKTKSVVKRISKAIMSVRDTEQGAITINNKTGYMNPAKDMISFYGVTGMKREITYKITNIKGAKFHLESLLLNLEYGTLIS